MVLTVGEWLRLPENRLLICEGNEDLDLIDVDAHQRITHVTEWQHKAENRKPTGIKALRTILGFMRAFRQHAAAGQTCAFVFTTTALLGDNGRRSGTSTVAGAIHRWTVWAEIEEPQRAEAGWELAELLARLLRKNASKLAAVEEVERERGGACAPSQTEVEVEALLAYLDDRPRWLDFLGAVHWRHGSPELEQLQTTVKQQLSDLDGLALPSELMLSTLIHAVLCAAIQPEIGGRCLTRERLLSVIGQSESELRKHLLEKDIPRLAEFVSPLVSAETFFFSATSEEDLLSLRGALVGREKELATLLDLPERSGIDVLMLVGAPGSGKSHLLRTLGARFREAGGPPVRFVDRHIRAFAPEIHVDLPNARSVIVYEDAEAGSGLELALACLTHTPERCKLILTTRPERVHGLEEELLRSAIPPTRVETVSLTTLSYDDARKLARQSLGFENLALEDQLVAHRDLPYAIVVAARLIARGEAHPSDLPRNDTFKRWVLDRVVQRAELATRDLSQTTGVPAQRVLELLAVLGKIRHPPDERIERAAAFVCRRVDEIAGVLDGLARVGVVRRRGRIWSVAPELLADRLAARACSVPGYAEAVYRAFEGLSDDVVLSHLAVLSAEPKSLLRSPTPFQTVWGAAVARVFKADRREQIRFLRRIGPVGFYQPEPVIELVREQLAAVRDENPERNRRLRTILLGPGNSSADVLDALALALQGPLHRLEYLNESLQLLDELRSRGVADDEAGRVGAYETGKHLAFNDAVIDFVEQQWDSADPIRARRLLDYIRPMVARSFREQRAEGHALHFRELSVSCVRTKALRERCRAVVGRALLTGNTQIAIAGAEFVNHALGPTPRGTEPESDEGRCWEAENLAWISAVSGIRPSSAPHVHIQVLESLRWHATFGRGPARTAAQATVDKITRRKSVREAGAVSSQYYVLLPAEPHDTFLDRLDVFFRSEARAFLKRYSSATEALDRFIALSRAAEDARVDFEPTQLVRRLADSSARFALDLVDELLRRDERCLQSVTGMLIAAGARIDRSKASRLATRVLREDVKGTVLSLAVPFSSGEVWTVAPRLARRVVVALLSHPDADISTRALDHLKYNQHASRKTRLALAFSVELDAAPWLTEKFCSAFANRRDMAVSTLQPAERELLLASLLAAPDLHGYWTEALLAQFVTRDCAVLVQFFLNRLRRRAMKGYEALPSLGFDKQLRAAFADGAGAPHLSTIWEFAMRARQGSRRLPILFWTVCGAYDRGIEFIESKARRCRAPGLQVIAMLLEEAPDGLVLQHPSLVELLLDRADAVSAELGREMEVALSNCARPRHVTAQMGEPAPVHVTARDAARAAMERLRAGSHTWRFFRDIERWCTREIDEHLIESEEMFA